MPKLLEINDIHFKYGEIHVVHGITMHVEEGEIVALLGGNGAGKTTTIRATSGLIKGLYKGEVLFKGKRIDGLPPHAIAKMGIAQCLEGRHVFSQLTVQENLEMGAYLRSKKKTPEKLSYIFDLFPRLEERKNQKAGTLSGGEQQMLAVGRALMQEPELLMMDEPSLGLAPLIIEDIFRTIKKINDDGITILLVEQNSTAALEIANRGYVIENGRIVYADTAENLSNNDTIRKSYLGIG